VTPTLRPEPPDECGAYPRCGLDVSGYCRCYPAAPTVPAPRPCQKRALVDALHRADVAARDVRQATLALPEPDRVEAWAVYLRERAARG
jgi:hypothetical protein